MSFGFGIGKTVEKKKTTKDSFGFGIKKTEEEEQQKQPVKSDYVTEEMKVDRRNRVAEYQKDLNKKSTATYDSPLVKDSYLPQSTRENPTLAAGSFEQSKAPREDYKLQQKTFEAQKSLDVAPPILRQLLIGSGISPEDIAKEAISMEEKGKIYTVGRALELGLVTPGMVPGEGSLFGKIGKASKIASEIDEIPQKPPIRPQEAIREVLPPKTAKPLTKVEQPLEAVTKAEPLTLEAKEAPITKPSGVAKQIEAKAIEKGLIDKGFDELADFSSSTIKQQAEMASQYSIDDMKLIAKGEVELPEGMRSGTALSVVEDFAIANNDVELLRELVKSPLTRQLSESASELSLSRIRESNSPVRKMEEIISDKIKYIEKKTGKKVELLEKDEVIKIKSSINKTIAQKATKQSWSEFIDSIQC